MTTTGHLIRRPVRGLVSAMTCVVVLLVGLAVPTLDRHLAGGGPGIEVEHHPSTCPPAHDHTVCVQIGHRLPTPTVHLWEGTLRLVAGAYRAADQDEIASRPLEEGHPSRASP